MLAHAKPEQKQAAKSTVQKKAPEKKVAVPNQTGIPDTMKTRFENLSGLSFDDVRVHYNSGKPAQLQALAYTQGNQVYVASGQERHLGHELGHVVQQKQGIVQQTKSINGFAVNDNPVLEREAGFFGTRASAPIQLLYKGLPSKYSPEVYQFASLASNKLNVAGEYHGESEPRRNSENTFCRKKIGTKNYWTEHEFTYAKIKDPNAKSAPSADLFLLRLLQSISIIDRYIKIINPDITKATPRARENLYSYSLMMVYDINRAILREDGFELNENQLAAIKKIRIPAKNVYEATIHYKGSPTPENFNILEIAYNNFIVEYDTNKAFLSERKEQEDIALARSTAMHTAANDQASQRGVWKIGNQHVIDIKAMFKEIRYNILSRDEFQAEYKEWRDAIIIPKQQKLQREYQEELSKGL
jgi:hypothetical protein